MKMPSLRVVYVSVALYVIYLFISNWGLSAMRGNDVAVGGFLYGLANYIVLPAIVFCVLYRLCVDFGNFFRSRWKVIAAFMAILVLVVATRNVLVVLPFVIGLISIGGDSKRIASTAAFTILGMLGLSILFSYVGLEGGNTFSKPLFGDDGQSTLLVSAFGLSNPNSVMLLYISASSMALYVCRTQRQRLISSLFLLVGAIVLSQATGSTTGFVIGVISIALGYLAGSPKSTLLRRFLRTVTPWAFLITTLVTFLVATVFGPLERLPNPINDSLTGRAYLWNLRVENGSYVNMYGSNDQYQSNSTLAGSDRLYALDNMPLYILVEWGALIFMIYFFVIYVGSKRIHDPVLQCYVLVACLLMFVERTYLYSFVLIFLMKGIMEVQGNRQSELNKVKGASDVK